MLNWLLTVFYDVSCCIDMVIEMTNCMERQYVIGGLPNPATEPWEAPAKVER